MSKKIISLLLAVVIITTAISACIANAYSYEETTLSLELIGNVVTKFDNVSYGFPVLEVDEYPSMEISNLATVIGGVCEENSITKGDVNLSFEAGSRLAKYNGGHLMLEREAVEYGGKLYVPISSLMTTLCYHIEYWRFDNPPTIEITSGTNYPESELTINVKDYGAKGDGVHDDKEPLLRAFAAASMSGKPVELVFEEGKTYKVSERQDYMSFFKLTGVDNFTLKGNGSTILFETPTNSLIYIDGCKNVKIQGLRAMYEEHTSSQGVIKAVDNHNGILRVAIDEGFSLLPPNEWVESAGGSWAFTQLIDPSGEYVKIDVPDVLTISKANRVSNRDYNVYIADLHKSYIQYCEVGDRVAFKTNPNSYNMNKLSKPGSPNAISIRNSADVVVENVDVCGSLAFAVEIGFCTGRITLRGLNMPRINGAIETTNSDGFHGWRSRAGLTVENCVLETNFDDHGNVMCNAANVTDRINQYTYKVDLGQKFMPGDEIVFFDPTSNKVLGTAFLKSFEGNHAGGIIVVDRNIEGVLAKNTDGASRPSIIWNANACFRGTVVRNNTFISSRRYATLFRAPNCLFDNNRIINCGGGLAAMNEVTSSWDEGPFPSALTVRNNYFEGAGNTIGRYPIDIRIWNSSSDTTPSIDGVLIENNIIDVANKYRMISIDSVRDLYMMNNTIRATKANILESTTPIVITNSEIKLIDGVKYEATQNIPAVITTTGCKIEENAIKNITKPEGNTSELTIVN